MEEYRGNYTTNNIADRSDERPFDISLVKVYLWLGLGLLLTGIVSLGLPMLLTALSDAGVDANVLSNTYLTILVVSLIVIIPCMIVIHLGSFFKKTGLVAGFYVAYTLAMGCLLSVILLVCGAAGDGFNTISLAFFVTSAVFILMGLIGTFIKKDLNVLWPLLFSILIGVLVISLVNFFIGSSMIYWLTDFIVFAVMLIVIAIDVHNVNRLAANRAFDNNTAFAIYCAFNLYVDFIWIFVRILYYITLLHRK